MPIIAKRQKREIPPENVYKAKIENIELENHEDYGERVRFDFDLLDHYQEDGRSTRVFRTCSFNFTPRSALTGIVEDILGQPLSDGDAYGGFDLETLIGSVVQVVVKHKQSAAGNTYAFVETIIHLGKETSESKDNVAF